MSRTLDELKGRWAIVALEADGQTMPPTTFERARIEIDGDSWISVGMGAEYRGQIEVDFTKTPHTLDLIFTAGPERGNRNLAIFEIDGDMWKLCVATRGPDRPTDFTTKAGTGHAFEILKREAAVTS